MEMRVPSNHIHQLSTVKQQYYLIKEPIITANDLFYRECTKRSSSKQPEDWGEIDKHRSILYFNQSVLLLQMASIII